MEVLRSLRRVSVTDGMRIANGEAPVDAYQAVTQIITAHLGRDDLSLTMDTVLEWFGIDDLENIEIVMELEDKLGLDLCPEELPRTIGDLVALIS